MAQMRKEGVIGDLLVRRGLIGSSELARAREAQEKEAISLGKALATLGLADEEAVSVAIAQSLNLELLSGQKPVIGPEVAALLPGDFCRQRLVVPLSLENKALRVAFVDPMDLATIQDVEFRTGKQVVTVVASQSSIQSLLDQFYPAPVSTSENALAGRPLGEFDLEQRGATRRQRHSYGAQRDAPAGPVPRGRIAS